MLRTDTRFSKVKTKRVNRLFFEKMTGATKKSASHFSEQPTRPMLKQPPTAKQANNNNSKSNPTSNENQHTIKNVKASSETWDRNRKNRKN
jgi:hypothetical protein